MQKRLIAILFVLMTVIGVSAVHALPTSDLTASASYLPDNTWLYATVRTDAGYSETLNGLLARLDANTGGDMIPDDAVIPPLADLVNDMVFPSYYTTEPIDSAWVGDTATFAIAGELDPNTLPEIYMIFEVADSGALTEAFDSVGATLTQADGYTVVDANAAPLYAPAVFNDEVLIVSQGMSDPADLLSLDSSLAASETFTGTLDLLPADDYNIAAYMDLGTMIDFLTLALMPMSADMDADNMAEMMMIPGMDNLDAYVGTFALGLTTLDGRTLAFDVAALPTNPDLYTSQPGFSVQSPVNLDFASHIPGETQLLIHDHNLSADTDAMIAALDALGPQLQAVLDMVIKQAMDSGMGMGDMQGLEQLDLSTLNFGGIFKNSIIPLFAGLTGLNLEDDVLAWMTEDYVTTASLLPVPSDLGFTFDITFLAAVTDSAAAANVVEKLATASDLYGLGATREENAVVYGDLIPALLVDMGLPASITEDPALDILVAANDEVFAVGSRPGVAFALNGGDGSLATNPVFQTASGYFVENAYSVWYVNTTSLADAIGALTILAESPTDEMDIEALQFVVAQIESMTISFNMQEDGASSGRLTLTLPESVTYPVPMDDAGNAADFNTILASLNKVAPFDLPQVGLLDSAVAENTPGN